MAYAPEQPFPKTKGHVIKSKDWNDAVLEIQRLDDAKVNRAGDNVTGSLNVAGSLGIGTTSTSRKLHVQGTEIHSGGSTGGFSFGNREASAFVEVPTAGERWVWYSSAGKARLWSGADKLSLHVDSGINVLTVGPGANGKIKTRHIDGKHYQNDNDDPLFLNWGTSQPVILGFGGPEGTTQTSLLVSGNLGVGTNGPTHKFHVVAQDAVGLFESSGTQAFLRLSTNEGINNRVEITNRPGGRLSLWTSGAGDVFNITKGGNVGIGTISPGAKFEVNGDVSLMGKHALRGNDPWLRLNQDRAFTAGVHTPGVFAPGSLNVGGYGGWGNPGDGNVWITGSVTIAGNLGTHGYPPSAHTPGWGGGIRTFDLEVEATAWIRNGVQTGNRDLAENFVSDMDLDPGDVVCMGYEEESVVASEEPDDELVLGVVSSKPGLLLNSTRDLEDDRLFPVALCGRVPCKVVDENGPIKRGDLLTTSSTPGHAMRAGYVTLEGHKTHRPGTIIGKALGTLESGTGVIEVFVTSR